MKMQQEFEEYKMKLIAFEGDIIATSWAHDSTEDPLNPGSGDEEFGDDLEIID